ncbi:DNA/RNA non-specific endonuclease [Flavobacterium psychrophilum]|uniref:DNA/RNA non-specific endonuclease n=1 Tax=Flavobacterium psychrophilum TaxID=96345 RepID=UPI00106C8794|nr:DNA/RNA non-specific endonuclease [Flavobacterium psychrophilum]
MKLYLYILLVSSSCLGQIVPIYKTKSIIYFDKSEKLPIYTRDTLNNQDFNQVFLRKKVKYDPSISSNFQSKHKDYLKDTLFDKGHLIPIINKNYSQNTLDEINVFTNIAPQYYLLNRVLWRDLEVHIKSLSSILHTNIIIWSGCDFGYRKIGNIKIPLRFWKLILVNGTYYAWSFENKKPLTFNYNHYIISPLILIQKINSLGFENINP